MSGLFSGSQVEPAVLVVFNQIYLDGEDVKIIVHIHGVEGPIVDLDADDPFTILTFAPTLRGLLSMWWHGLNVMIERVESIDDA